ncbi:hypothetical protein HK098_008189 [Nowakowskiella sp. JEL0407]|nr:hypothetical protein HK098_008189 [Nowakowskiella sp. JEL0407]
MKPVYAELSKKYRHVVFTEIDVDQQQELAREHGVSAMPTFQFYKAGNRVAELKGANPGELERLVKLHQGPSSDASESVGGQYVDLTDFVNIKQLECLNEDSEHPVQKAFEKGGTLLKSDVDEQLILNIQFNVAVKLHSIKIIAPVDKAPKTIKTYVNRPQTLSFDEIDSVAETECIEFTEDDYKDGTALKKLRFVKYQSVHSVQLFIADNLTEDDVTAIQQIIFYGVSVETTNMADLKKNDPSQGEK